MKLCNKSVFVDEGFPPGLCSRRVNHPDECRPSIETPLVDQLYDLAERVIPQSDTTQIWKTDFARLVALYKHVVDERWHENHERHHDLEIVHACAREIVALPFDAAIAVTADGVPERRAVVYEPWMDVACDAIRARDSARVLVLLQRHAPLKQEHTFSANIKTKESGVHHHVLNLLPDPCTPCMVTTIVYGGECVQIIVQRVHGEGVVPGWGDPK